MLLPLGLMGLVFVVYFMPPTRQNLLMRRLMVWTIGWISGVVIQPSIIQFMYSGEVHIVYAALGTSIALFASFGAAVMSSSRAQAVYAVGTAVFAISALSWVSLLNYIYPTRVLSNMSLLVGLAGLCVSAVVHTSNMIERAAQNVDIDPVVCALGFFNDLVQMFLHLVALLSNEQRRKEEERRKSRRSGPKKKGNKGQKMSLQDFLGDSATTSWADDEVSLPSAPMATTIPVRSTLANALDRKDMVYQRSDMPIEFPTSGPFTAYVGNLPFDVTEETLEQMFGPAEQVRLIRDRETDRLKGFGYIEFANVEGLKRAVGMDGTEVSGRPVRVSVSEKREERGSNNWRAGDGARGFGESREPTAAETTSDWRVHKEPAAERMGGSRSSSGFERGGSGFERSSSGFERSGSGFGRPREMREPREPTVAEATSDWRVHKEPEAGAAPAPERRGRFSRTSSGDAGEERAWRSPRMESREPREHREYREPREPREYREPREPRVPTQADQASSWRTARATPESSNNVDRAEKPKASDERRSGRFRQHDSAAANESSSWRRAAN
ncbi:Eukaryotic translation initiation factor 4B [Coemansia sp. RSA 2131]|nr:Eukaryotic translation initiation factor 4B [Coemansia sp. RSA 2131]